MLIIQKEIQKFMTLPYLNLNNNINTNNNRNN